MLNQRRHARSSAPLCRRSARATLRAVTRNQEVTERISVDGLSRYAQITASWTAS